MSSPERPGQNPNVLQSSSLNKKGSATFARTTYPPETKFPKGDARNEVFYQPARPVPTEKPVKPEISPKKLSLLARLAIVLGSVAITGGVGLSAQHHIEAQEELSLPGIGRDIGAIPQTAEKDYHLALRALGLEIVVPSVFDNNLWGKQQGLVNGTNARPATKEEIQKLLEQNLVFENPKPAPHPLRDPVERKAYWESLPTVSIPMPVDLRKAQRVDVTKVNGDNSVYFDFIITGDDVPFYIPLPPGVKNVEARTKDKGILFTYFLNNGRTITGRVLLGRGNFSYTGAKDIPITPDIRNAEPKKDFDLTQNPFVDIFHTSGPSKISIDFLTRDGENFGPPLNPSLIENGGKTLSSPTL